MVRELSLAERLEMELYEEIAKLAEVMTSADLGEILIEREDARIRLRKSVPERGKEVVTYSTVPLQAPPVQAATVGAPQVVGAGAPPPASGPAAGAPAGSDMEGLVEFVSPMVGTFYRAPSPESEPYVQVGSKVRPDTVLCIIEAMKVMNEIAAETHGEIEKILVENGEPVEFGQPLFLIRPA